VDAGEAEGDLDPEPIERFDEAGCALARLGLEVRCRLAARASRLLW
jgi:hypothetical protein